MEGWNRIWNGRVEENMEWKGGMEYGMDGECTLNHVTETLLSLCRLSYTYYRLGSYLTAEAL